MTTLTPDEFQALATSAEVTTKGMLAKQHATLKAHGGQIPDEPLQAIAKGLPALPYDPMACGYTLRITGPTIHTLAFIKLLRDLIPETTLIEAVQMRDGEIAVVHNVEGMTAQALYLSLTTAGATLDLTVSKAGNVVPLYVLQPSVEQDPKGLEEAAPQNKIEAALEMEAEQEMGPEEAAPKYHYDDETPPEPDEPEKAAESAVPQEVWQTQNWYCDDCEVYHNKGTKCPVVPTTPLDEFEVVFTATPVVMKVMAKNQEEANRVAQNTFDPLRTTWES